MRIPGCALVVILVAVPLASAKKDPPTGVIAASVGEEVVLANPATGTTSRFQCGTVGWLYEGPAGALFAPDLLAGRTTVFDLRAGTVAERMDGVTMPHFGPVQPDRYVVVAGDVLMVSYPERAVIGRIEAEIAYPWQVLMISDSVLMVLEKGPTGDGPVTLTALDLVSSQQVYRRPLSDGVERLALSRELGLLAVADADTSAVTLVEPATLTPVAVLATSGPAADLVFLDEQRALASVSAMEGSTGELRVWNLKAKKGALKVKKERSIALPARPLRVVASPAQDRIAVALAGGVIEVVELEKLTTVATIELPGVPRDVVWCDPLRPGPPTPEWSSEKEPELRMDP
jgi:hypothetical protein